jgi:hypothetical protein
VPAYASPYAGTPVLLPAQPDAAAPPADPGLTGGSTGLRPGVDCLPDPAACKHYPRLYGEVAYMLTWISDGPTPGPLVVALPRGGVVGGPGTFVLNGGDKFNFDAFNGITATAGVWLDDHATYGIETSGFLLERQNLLFGTSASGGPNSPLGLARPFVDATTGQVTPFPVAVQGALAGGVLTSATSRFWGADGDFVLNYRDSCQSRIDLLAGFAYYDLRETLGINQSSVVLRGPFPGIGNNIDDFFDARNQFYGGQVGTRATYTLGRLSLTLVSKLALGVTHEVVDRIGATTTISPIGMTNRSGGLLVLPTNAGTETRDQFAVALPSSLQLGYQITQHLSAFVGYNVVYLSSVARPGDQVDLVVNTAGLGVPPGTPIVPARPAGGVDSRSFWANSLTVGMGYKW